MKNNILASALLIAGIFMLPQASQAVPIPPGAIVNPNPVCTAALGAIVVPVQPGNVSAGCSCLNRQGNMYARVKSGVKCPAYVVYMPAEPPPTTNTGGGTGGNTGGNNNTLVCTGGQVVSGGVCVCPANTSWSGTSCVTQQVLNCTGNQVVQGGKCVCPSDKPVLDNGTCHVACTTGTSWTNGQCVATIKTYNANTSFQCNAVNSGSLGILCQVNINTSSVSVAGFASQSMNSPYFAFNGDAATICGAVSDKATNMAATQVYQSLADKKTSFTMKMNAYSIMKRGVKAITGNDNMTYVNCPATEYKYNP